MSAPFRGAVTPLRWLGQLIAMSAIPAALVALACWLMDPAGMAFVLVLATAGLYELLVLWAWSTAVAGQLRSLARGTYDIRDTTPTRPRRRRRGRYLGEEEL